MPLDSATLQQAHDAGYSDDEIYDHLAKTDPKFAEAKQNGYALADVARHFDPQPGTEPSPTPAGQITQVPQGTSTSDKGLQIQQPNLVELRKGKLTSAAEMPLPPASLLYDLGIPKPVGPQEGVAKQVLGGIANFPVDVANFALSPAGLASAGVLPVLKPTLQKVISGIFGATQAYQAYEEPTLQGKVEAGIGAALGAAGAVKLPSLVEALKPIFGESKTEAAPVEAPIISAAEVPLYEPLSPVEAPVAPEPVPAAVPIIPTPTEALPTAETPTGEQPNAVQEPQAGEILQRQPQEIGGAGGERVGVEPNQQGQEAPAEVAPAAAETQPVAPSNITGLKRVTVDTERLSRGTEPIPAVERQHEEGVVKNAEERVKTNPSAAPSLVAKIVDGGERAITEHDAATLLVERARLMNERAKWEEVRGSENSSPSEQVHARTELERIEVQQERLDRAQRTAGSTWGRLGHMYQRMIREDFSLEAMKRKERAVKGRPLTEDEINVLKGQSQKFEKLQNAVDSAKDIDAKTLEQTQLTQAYEETIARLKGELAKKPEYSKGVLDIARGVVDRWKADAEDAHKSLSEKLSRTSAGVDPTIILDLARIMRPRIAELGLDFAETSTRLLAQYGNAIEPYLRKAWDQAKKLIDSEKITGAVKTVIKKGAVKPEKEIDLKGKLKADAAAGDELDSKLVGQIVESQIRAGVHGEDALMKATHNVVKEAYPDATERDVRRAFSEYGKARFPNKEAVATEKRELRRLVQMQESIDRLKAGLDALHSGPQREKATQLVREKTAQLNELLKKRQGPPSPERLAGRDKARQTAIQNRIDDIKKELETGERKAGGAPTPMSEKTKALVAERNALQEKLNQARKAREEADPAAMAEKSAASLESQRQTLQKQIDVLKAGQRVKLGPNVNRPLHPSLEPLAQERDALRVKLAEARKKPEAQKATEQMQKRLEQLNDKINLRQAKLSVGDVSREGPGQKMNRPLSPELESTQQELDAINKQIAEVRKAPDTITVPKTPEERYNQTRMKAIQKRLDELSSKTAAKDFSRPGKRTPPPKNEATRQAEVQLKTEQNKFTENILRQEQAKKPTWQRAMEGTGEAAKGFAISGYHSITKIAGFDLAKLVAQPFHEAVGTVVSKLTGNAPAYLESGAGFKKATGAYYSGFSRGVKEALGVYRTGRSESDLIYGKPRLNDAHWYDWIGSRLHGALKHPIFNAAEERYRANGFANAEKAGLDISNEFVRAEINHAAFEKAQGAKLQENNIVSQGVDMLHTKLEREMPDTGQPDIKRMVLSTMLKTFITKGIVKTPANFVSQVVQHSPAGLLTGAGELGRGYIKGLDKLTPREVDAIHGLLKAGAVGSALFVWGMIDATKRKEDRVFGGFYTGNKTEAGDVSPNKARMGGFEVHRLTHNLVFAEAQMGNTIMRVAKSKFRKSDKETKGFPTAVMSSILSLASQAPISGPLMRADQRTDVGADLVSGLVPQLIQNIAEDTDSEERKPRTKAEKLKSAIPYLRQQVPTSAERKAESQSSNRLPALKD